MGTVKRKARPLNQRYVQFSKVIIVAVTAAVTVICGIGMLLCYQLGDSGGLVDVCRAYISYAMVAFTAYSGNSAVEKWLIKKYSGNLNDSTNDDTSCG